MTDQLTGDKQGGADDGDMKALAQEIYFGGEVKALDDNGKVGGYLIRYGTDDDPDLTGDYFSKNTDFGELANKIKKISYKITSTGELIGRELAQKLDIPFGVIDLSLAPTPAIGDSVAGILEAMGLERTGTHGTTAALAMLNDAVKKGGIMASSYVGGLSGAFIPVSEDAGMIEAAKLGALTFDKLEAMTSVCSVGLDMIAIPGSTSAETLSGIIADEMAIGMINKKTTAVRVIPVPGKEVGDYAVYGGLLGEAPIIPVNKYSCSDFVNRGGRIPAPIHSLNN